MKALRLSLYFCFLVLGFAVTALSSLVPSAVAQGGDANSILDQLTTAFSGGRVVQQIQLSGTATWNAGSLEDTGNFSMTASTNGSSQLQLDLSASGTRTETQSGVGSSAICQWAGADGVVHQIDSHGAVLGLVGAAPVGGAGHGSIDAVDIEIREQYRLTVAALIEGSRAAGRSAS